MFDLKSVGVAGREGKREKRREKSGHSKKERGGEKIRVRGELEQSESRVELTKGQNESSDRGKRDEI